MKWPVATIQLPFRISHQDFWDEKKIFICCLLQIWKVSQVQIICKHQWCRFTDKHQKIQFLEILVIKVWIKPKVMIKLKYNFISIFTQYYEFYNSKNPPYCENMSIKLFFILIKTFSYINNLITDFWLLLARTYISWFI